MEWVIGLFALLVVWTVVNVLFLIRPRKKGLRAFPLVTVAVPMRNEARNVHKCVAMLKRFTYPNVEFVIYEDQSTDKTYQLLLDAIAGDARFRVERGVPLPTGWVGKVHACYQLRKYANGDFIAFVDADVELVPDALERLVGVSAGGYSLVTGFPKFRYTNWFDRLVLPMMHFVVYVHLPIMLANRATYPSMTAANGICMLFKTSDYDAAGGHLAVQQSLVEDVHIARAMKEAGFRVALVRMSELAQVTMYETAKETLDGFTKNSFTGIGRSYTLAVGVTLFYLMYVATFGLALWGFATSAWMLIVPSLLVVLQRVVTDVVARSNILYSVFMPFASIALIIILWRSALRSSRKKGYEWKGRMYG